MDIGDTVDDFSVVDQHGIPVTLSDLVANGSAVIYFYIKAKTPG